MEAKPKIPRPTVKRLSLYFREVGSLVAAGRRTISSKQLGSALGLTGAQVRKDLAFFGQLGHPGVGYEIARLYDHLRQVLGRDRTWNAALVGVGNIGRALLAYQRFAQEDFHITAVFDSSDGAIGCEYGGRTVHGMNDMPALVRDHDIKLGIVAVPAEAAQQVADALIESGVTGILNFAPRRLDVEDTISVTSVDFTLALEQLAFQVSVGLTGSFEGQAS
jgi:redox-sensing transcriptional repressor